MLACASAALCPAAAIAQDSPAEIPDIAASQAQPGTTGPEFSAATQGDPEIWATVNICDTPSSPDSMGVRASMPGNGTNQRMWMRFRAEYWSRGRQAWAHVTGTGISPWVYAGSAHYAHRQAGWTFGFAAPPAGVTFTMRAQVDFQWRARLTGAALRRQVKRFRMRRLAGRTALRSGRAVRTLTQSTETGIKGVDGGDPLGTSKAMCLIY
jgi:hypothetical protein